MKQFTTNEKLATKPLLTKLVASHQSHPTWSLCST